MLDYQSGHTARSIHRYYADVEVDIVFKDATSQALRTFLDGSNWALVTINAAVFTNADPLTHSIGPPPRQPPWVLPEPSVKAVTSAPATLRSA
jgi:hypothetical protein